MNHSPFNPAPFTSWSEIGKKEHFVQLYREDQVLVLSVSGYLEGAVRAREAAILIATPEHRKAIEDHLKEDGFDLEALKACDQYFSLDAAETLSRFMVDGLPDEQLFTVTIGGIMSRATRNGRSVRAFGEMVALLWSQGNRDGAIRLEDLWNNLAQTYSFALFCAYPLQSVMGSTNAAPFVHVCRQHSRVISSDNCMA